MKEEKWIVKYWRPTAAWVYLTICVFDFVIMPVYFLKSQGDLNKIVEISMQLRPEDRLTSIVQLSKRASWEPLTLHESGFFHVAFATILGVAAWTRGRVQEVQARNTVYSSDGGMMYPNNPMFPNNGMGFNNNSQFSSNSMTTSTTDTFSSSTPQPTPRPSPRPRTSKPPVVPGADSASTRGNVDNPDQN